MVILLIVMSLLLPSNSSKVIKDYLETPDNYERIKLNDGFGEFIQNQPVNKRGVVWLHDGGYCEMHHGYVAVYNNYNDVHIWEQCADVIMHLRYDYNRSIGKETSFTWLSGKTHAVKDSLSLVKAYEFCNTKSLVLYDTYLISMEDMQIGDMLINADISPGHAILITDIVTNGIDTLVAFSQGYMPARSFHMLSNNGSKKEGSSPYFKLKENMFVAGYEFNLKNHIRRFKQ